MTDSRVLSLLGFASKAGKLSYGFEASVASVKSGKARVIVVSGEISEKSKKELRFFADKKSVPIIVLTDSDIQAVSSAVGRKCGILAVTDSSFSEGVLEAVQTGGNANEQ